MAIKDEVKDVGERVLWTAAEAFLAVVLVTDLSTYRSAAVAAVAAAVVPVKEWVKAKRTAADLDASA